jgi:cell shape-determining protein MreC
MKKWLFALIMLIGVYAVVSGEFLIEAKGRMFAFIRESFSSEGEADYLREENQKLELELLNLKNGNHSFKEINGLEAKVFSAYPFADRSEIIIGAGDSDGIMVGDAVICEGVLVGRIKETGDKTSVVQTVFDPEFQVPVRIGEAETDALYVGGMNPKLNMIDSAETLKQGELIYSAAADLPYGLGMGRTLEISEGALKEASLEPLLEIKKLRNVVIVSR